VGIDGHEKVRSGAQVAFVNRVELRGDVLYAAVELNSEAAELVVSRRGFRGFSMEARKNPKLPTGEFNGWVLVGGVFTNTPALDTVFQIAATARINSDAVAHCNTALSLPAPKAREESMSEQTTAPAAEEAVKMQSQIKAQESAIATLRSQVEALTNEKGEIDSRLAESAKDVKAANIALADVKAQLSAVEDEKRRTEERLAKVEKEKRELDIRLEATETRSLRESVVKIAQDAIDRGVTAKYFEKLEEDPVAWFKDRFVSLEAMKEAIASLPTVKESAITSGRKPDAKTTLSPESEQRMRRLGLDPKYAAIATEDDLLALKAKEGKK
jgi:hypothetical protein